MGWNGDADGTSCPNTREKPSVAKGVRVQLCSYQHSPCHLRLPKWRDLAAGFAWRRSRFNAIPRALWTTERVSQLWAVCFSFDCFFCASFQTPIWSHAIRIPDICTSCSYGPFSLFSSSTGLALGLPRYLLSGLMGKSATGQLPSLLWGGTSLSLRAAWGPLGSASLHHPKLRPPSYQLLPASQA